MAQLLYSYRTFSQSDLSAMASRVGELTFNNPIYLAAKTSVTALRTANTEYIRKSEIAKQGGKDRIGDKNDQYKILLDAMDLVAADVVILAKGDEDTITGAGFKVRTVGKPISELPRPVNVLAEFFPKEGSFELSFDKIKGINYYMIRGRVLGEEWQIIRHTTTPKSTILHGFTLGVRMEFAVQAMGSDGLVSDWSYPSEITIS